MYRTYRFSVHYGRELDLQFLTMPDSRAKALRKKATKRNDGERTR